ncbi:MAG: Hsp20/alpha crystallin family protein [Promethearchaeota archaeon]
MNKDEKKDIVEKESATNIFGLSDLERMFRSMWRYPFEWSRRLEEGFRTPLSEVDVDDKTGNTNVTLELPGVSREEIEVTVNKSSLIVRAESENRKYKRSFSFSQEFDPVLTKASFSDGVLEISLKAIKTKEVKGHRVEID